MNHRREQGVSLRNDITRYELQLQQIALGQTTVSDRQSVLTKQLRTALGTDSVPKAMLSDDAFEGVEMAVGSEEDWLRLAWEQHKTLQRSALAVDISLTQERLVEAERYPQVALVAEDHLDGPITIEVPPINKNLNYWLLASACATTWRRSTRRSARCSKQKSHGRGADTTHGGAADDRRRRACRLC